MQLSSRFTMGVHLLTLCAAFPDMKTTSDFIAGSVGTNPVIIRKLLQQLKAAEIIDVCRGTGGVTIKRPLNEITFLDVYNAVECTPEEELFRFHENPSEQCPVGSNIHNLLDARIAQVQKVFENELASMTIADVCADLNKILE